MASNLLYMDSITYKKVIDTEFRSKQIIEQFARLETDIVFIGDSFYVNFAEGLVGNKKATHVCIEYIDRGVDNFEEFTEVIQAFFPNITFLEWSQNYSHNMFMNTDKMYATFLDMITKLSLTKLNICDEQSQIFKTLKISDIMERMPDNSFYVIFVGNDKVNADLGMYFDKMHNKTFIFDVKS